MLSIVLQTSVTPHFRRSCYKLTRISVDRTTINQYHFNNNDNKSTRSQSRYFLKNLDVQLRGVGVPVQRHRRSIRDRLHLRSSLKQAKTLHLLWAWAKTLHLFVSLTGYRVQCPWPVMDIKIHNDTSWKYCILTVSWGDLFAANKVTVFHYLSMLVLIK